MKFNKLFIIGAVASLWLTCGCASHKDNDHLVIPMTPIQPSIRTATTWAGLSDARF